MAFVACGSSDDSSPTPQAGSSSTTTASVAKKPPEPRVEVPEAPPPMKLVIEVLKEGNGAVAKVGDEITIREVGVMYKTGKELEAFWEREPLEIELTRQQMIEGWVQGLKGMRVGGRRELIIPSGLAFGKGAMIYVVELISVKKVGSRLAPGRGT